MILRRAVKEELHSTWFLLLEFVKAEEKVEVTSNYSKINACLGMARRSGQLDEMGVYRKAWVLGCGQGVENLESPVQNFKTYLRSNKKIWSFGSNLERNSGAGNFTSGRRPIREWSRGFPTVFHRSPQGSEELSWAPGRG